jgi:hypothetical protein
MTVFARRLTPLFAIPALLAAGSGLPGRAQADSAADSAYAPGNSGAVYAQGERFIRNCHNFPRERIAAEVKDWRDAFQIVGETPADTAAVTASMNRIFANPEVRDALRGHIQSQHEVAEHLGRWNGARLPFETVRQLVEDINHKTLILASRTAERTTILSPEKVHLNIGGSDRIIPVQPAIAVQTKPDTQYMDTQGRYRDETLDGALAHELAHFLLNDPSERSATQRGSEWMKAIDPGYAPRGDYYSIRLKSDSKACKAFRPLHIAQTAWAFTKEMRDKNPADPDPVVRRPDGQVLKDDAAALQWAKNYYAPCKQAPKAILKP